jgi:hypothetical protein
VVARLGRGRERVERHGYAVDWAGRWRSQGNGEKIGAGYRKERLPSAPVAITRDGNTFYGLARLPRLSLKPHTVAQVLGVLAFRSRRLVDSLVLPTHRHIAVTDELVVVEIDANAEVTQGRRHGSRLHVPGEEVKFILTRLKRNSRGGCFL